MSCNLIIYFYKRISFCIHYKVYIFTCKQYTLCKVIHAGVIVISCIWYKYAELCFISIQVCGMSTILAGGTWALAPIITSLSSTLSEFIPYVVYVGLGVLGAVIWFVAIKWLMNWTRAKVLGTFSSRRRR